MAPPAVLLQSSALASHVGLCRTLVLPPRRIGRQLREGSGIAGTPLPSRKQLKQHNAARKVAQGASSRRCGPRALFTGIVEEMGEVRELAQVEGGGWLLRVASSTALEGTQLGDSISVNGVCLTVTTMDQHSFTFGLAPETLRRTNLGALSAGQAVNLERSLRPDSRMGGHFVQGHVDGTGSIVSLTPESDSLWVKVSAPPQLMRYIVPKGFIAVDGTSLTVVDVFDEESAFTFMLVAYTQQKIVVASKQVGDTVNLEVDILGKYVERSLAWKEASAKSLSS